MFRVTLCPRTPIPLYPRKCRPNPSGSRGSEWFNPFLLRGNISYPIRYSEPVRFPQPFQRFKRVRTEPLLHCSSRAHGCESARLARTTSLKINLRIFPERADRSQRNEPGFQPSTSVLKRSIQSRRTSDDGDRI